MCLQSIYFPKIELRNTIHLTHTKKNPTFFGTRFQNQEVVYLCVKCVVLRGAVFGKYNYYTINIKITV
jgi:hypothetical protein